MTNDKLLANRRNALLSTGPRSAGGLARASKNALAHGLHSAAVVPALGETAEDLADLCAEVRAVLQPDSLLKGRLCDRIALLLLRLGRVARFEAAAAAAYGDPKVVDAVVRPEGHLTRQLGLALDLLDRLRAGRAGDGEPGLTDLLRGLAAR